MDKKELRKLVISELSQLTDVQYFELSKRIVEKLLLEAAIRNAQTIAVTLSNKPEVDTNLLIEKLWDSHKTVVVPKCSPKDRSMQFYVITHFDQLETVYMNLREPITEKTILKHSDDIDLIIVPGVVYDLCGYRVGFGGGYYDRYLVNYAGTLITLAFDMQVVQEVPRELHDIPVDIIITDKRSINCSANRKEFSNEIND